MDNSQFNQIADDYLKDMNKQYKNAAGIELDEQELDAIKELALNLEVTDNENLTRVLDLLAQVGYDQSQMDAVVDELFAISSLRLLIKLYASVPLEKLDKMEDLADELSPTQFTKMVEIVFKNHTGEDYEELSVQYLNETLDAYYKDMSAAWQEIQAGATEDPSVE